MKTITKKELAAADRLRRAIRAACTRRGDQAHLARTAGISETNLCHFLAGRYRGLPAAHARIATALDQLAQRKDPAHEHVNPVSPADRHDRLDPGGQLPPLRRVDILSHQATPSSTPAADPLSDQPACRSTPAPSLRPPASQVPEGPASPVYRHQAPTGLSLVIAPLDGQVVLRIAHAGDALALLLDIDEVPDLAGALARAAIAAAKQKKT